MRSGDKVIIDCPEFGNGIFTGTVHTKNFHPEMISVHLDNPMQGIYDFDETYLTKIEGEKNMSAIWKKDKSQVGLVTNVYITDWGQKRLTVRMPYSTIDAAAYEFELI